MSSKENMFILSMDRKFSLQVRLGEDIEKMAVRLGDVALLPGGSELELLPHTGYMNFGKFLNLYMFFLLVF